MEFILTKVLLDFIVVPPSTNSYKYILQIINWPQTGETYIYILIIFVYSASQERKP